MTARFIGYGAGPIEEGFLDTGHDVDADLPGNQSSLLFRDLTAQGNRDFSSMEKERLRRRLIKSVHTLPLGKNLIDISVDFIIGDAGFTPKIEAVKDDPPLPKEYQEAIDSFWFDRNQMETNQAAFVRDAEIEGELLIDLSPNPIDMIFRLGVVPGELVQAVKRRRRGPVFQLADSVILVHNLEAPDRPLRWRAVNEPDDVVFDSVAGDGVRFLTPMVQGVDPKVLQVGIRADNFNGIGVYVGHNRMIASTRGKSDLEPLLEWIDLHDQLIFMMQERMRLAYSILLQVVFENAKDEADAKGKAAAMGLTSVPEGGSVFATGPGVKFDFLNPGMKLRDDFQPIEKIVRGNCFGSLGLPETFSGLGGDVNYATALAMGSVPVRRLGRKQGRWKAIFRLLVEGQITLLEAKQKLPGIKGQRGRWVVTMEATPISQDDRVKSMQALKEFATSLQLALLNGWITEQQGRTLYGTAVQQTGFDFTIEEAAGLQVEELNARSVQQAQQILAKMKQDEGSGHLEDEKKVGVA